MIACFEKMWSPVARQMKKLVFGFFASFFCALVIYIIAYSGGLVVFFRETTERAEFSSSRLGVRLQKKEREGAFELILYCKKPLGVI